MTSAKPDDSGAPLVSALVLCHNHARFLAQCLDSVYRQTYANIEVIIMDDCSTDESPRLIAEWIERHGVNWKFIKNQKNLGLNKTLNHAIRESRGSLIASVSTDDVWLEDKTEKQVAFIRQLPHRVGVIYGDAVQIDETGRVLPKMFIESHRDFLEPPQGSIEVPLWEDNFIPVPTTMVRRECFDTVGPYDESLSFEDWDMWVRIAQFFDFAYFPSITAKYRIVLSSMTRRSMDTMVDSMCRMCEKHLRSGKLAPDVRRAALAQLENRAVISYRLRTKRHKRNLLSAAVAGRSRGLVAGLLFALLGLSYDTFERTRLAIRRSGGVPGAHTKKT